MEWRNQVSIEVRGVKLVAKGVNYYPQRRATLKDPPESDYATWDLLHTESDAGMTNVTVLLSASIADAVEEAICNQFRD